MRETIVSAAVAHDRAILAEARQQRGREAAQAFVADLMAVDVVDLLETVEVEEEDRRFALDRAEDLRQRAPVRQAGQRIAIRELLQHFLRRE